jgi:alpha-glucosidase
MAPAHAALAANKQEHDTDSVLWFTRSLVALRKLHPALATGDMRVLAAGDQVLAFERAGGGDHIVCVFNLSASEASFELGNAGQFVPLDVKVGAVQRSGTAIRLGARSAYLARRAT